MFTTFVTKLRATLARGYALLALVVLLTIAGLGAYHDREMMVDDSYISFRYARNLADGFGLRWNQGSAPCEGYTNLLYISLLAVGRSLGFELPATGVLIGIASSVIVIAILFMLAQRARAWAPAAIALVLGFMCHPELRIHASRGLETMLFSAIALVLFLEVECVGRGETRFLRAGTFALLSFALILCRPDGIVLLAPMWCAVLLQRYMRRRTGYSREVVGALALLLICVVGYLAWKQSYFGYMLPNSYYAKATREGLNGIAETQQFLRTHAWWLICVAFMSAIGFVIALRSGSMVSSLDWRPLLSVVVLVGWCGYNAKIVHEMGYASRFLFPILPIMAAGGGLLLDAWQTASDFQHGLSGLSSVRRIRPFRCTGMS